MHATKRSANEGCSAKPGNRRSTEALPPATKGKAQRKRKPSKAPTTATTAKTVTSRVVPPAQAPASAPLPNSPNATDQSALLLEHLPAGLKKLKNTCYVNAVLPGLVRTPALADLCISHSFSGQCECQDSKCCTVCLLGEVLTELMTGSGCVSPESLLSNLKLDTLDPTDGQQQDAPEFLRQLLGAMDRDLGAYSSANTQVS